MRRRASKHSWRSRRGNARRHAPVGPCRRAQGVSKGRDARPGRHGRRGAGAGRALGAHGGFVAPAEGYRIARAPNRQDGTRGEQRRARVHAGGEDRRQRAVFVGPGAQHAARGAEGAAAASRDRQGRRRRATAGVGKGWARERTRGGGRGNRIRRRRGTRGDGRADPKVRRREGGRGCRRGWEPTPAAAAAADDDIIDDDDEPRSPRAQRIRPVDGRRAGSRERRGGRAPKGGLERAPADGAAAADAVPADGAGGG